MRTFFSCYFETEWDGFGAATAYLKTRSFLYLNRNSHASQITNSSELQWYRSNLLKQVFKLTPKENVLQFGVLIWKFYYLQHKRMLTDYSE